MEGGGWPCRQKEEGSTARPCLARPCFGARPKAARAEPRQLDMTTHDDEAWLRGFAPRRSRALGGSAADSRLDGMKRAKRSSERPAASKPPSADVAKASDSADEPPAAAAAPSGPADPDGRTGARRGRRSRAARAAQPADEAAEPAPEALPPLPSPGSLHGMTCPQLRELARAHAMPISGTKSELVRALLLRARQVQAGSLHSRGGSGSTAALPSGEAVSEPAC